MDALDCSLTTELFLPSSFEPELDIGSDLLVNQGERFEMRASTNIPSKEIKTIEWSGLLIGDCESPCLTPEVSAINSGTVMAKITSVDGCEATAELELTVVPKLRIFIPNAFSPNGDGVNDRFIISAESEISAIQSLQIFDRWGEQVFKATDFAPNELATAWDGLFNNLKVNPGVFVYLLKVQLADQSTEQLSGTLTLIY